MWKNSCGDVDWPRIVMCIMFWICAMVVATWGTDRDAPFTVLAYDVRPVRAGEQAMVTVMVKRDLDRGCSVTFSRYIYDSSGFRVDLSTDQVMSAEGIRIMDTQSPNLIRLVLPIHPKTSPGKARYVTELEYVCNPIQKVWPIQVRMEIPIEVTL